MKAFIKTEMTREELGKRVYGHYKADEIIQGEYWQNGKGCMVGCWIHGLDHSLFEPLFGISQLIAGLCDKIFEELPALEAKEFVVQVFEAIHEGAYLSLFWPKFAVKLLTDPEHGAIRFDQSDNIKNIAKLYQRTINREIVTEKEWINAKAAAAADAYDAAYYSAASAYAYSSAHAYAHAHAHAAAHAAATAYAHVYASARAVVSDYATKHFQWQRDVLLELLEETKPE